MIDVEDVCDVVWHGTNGDGLCEQSGCAGCHYVMGAAAVLGLIGMAKVLAARERARPIEPIEGEVCDARRPGDGLKCNLIGDHSGEHKHINRSGRVRWSWPRSTSASPEKP